MGRGGFKAPSNGYESAALTD